MNENRVTEAIILAGGLGTRLRSIVSDVPKPMAPVNGRPFLEFLLDYWIQEGVNRFILSVGHLAETIVSHFGSDYRGCNIQYAHESTPLGTGGGLRHALRYVSDCSHTSRVLLMNGDTWFEVKLLKLIADAQARNTPITIALKPMEQNERYGGVAINTEGGVTSFGEKSNQTSFINGGCYLLEPKKISKALEGLPSKFSLENDFLVPLAAEGNITASIQDVTFSDIGIPSDYKLTENMLKEK